MYADQFDRLLPHTTLIGLYCQEGEWLNIKRGAYDEKIERDYKKEFYDKKKMTKNALFHHTPTKASEFVISADKTKETD